MNIFMYQMWCISLDLPFGLKEQFLSVCQDERFGGKGCRIGKLLDKIGKDYLTIIERITSDIPIYRLSRTHRKGNCLPTDSLLIFGQTDINAFLLIGSQCWLGSGCCQSSDYKSFVQQNNGGGTIGCHREIFQTI